VVTFRKSPRVSHGSLRKGFGRSLSRHLFYHDTVAGHMIFFDALLKLDFSGGL
jgi:hypothetical protein